MKATIYFLLSIISCIAYSQNLKEKADEHFANGEWQEASSTYLQHLSSDTNDSSAWYNLAFSKLKLKNYEEAINYFNKAEEQNYPVSFIFINKAKAHLLKGDHEAALKELSRGAEKGATAYVRLKTDLEFDPIRNMKGFSEVLEKIKLNAYPCLSDSKHRHMDFWLGEWEVYANGRKVGDNTISLANGGCALHESYTTDHNYSGQSINYYDPIDEKWHQHWVGSAGDVYNYLETAKSKGMIRMESKFINPKGQLSLSRMTFTLNEDGTVRQLMESSTDDGNTWSIAFDGLYKPKIN